MEERQTTIDGERYPLSPIFTVLATENPIEYEGTYPLPEAQLDRFLMQILIDYPDQADEEEIVARWDAGFNARHLDQVNIVPLSDATMIQRCRAEVRDMRMEPGVQKYIVEIVRKTRSHPTILYGASPRGSVALLLCSKALAAIRGRDFPTPDDIRDVALPVLRHRLALRAEALVCLRKLQSDNNAHISAAAVGTLETVCIDGGSRLEEIEESLSFNDHASRSFLTRSSRSPNIAEVS